MPQPAITHRIGDTRISRIQDLAWDNKPPGDLYPDWNASTIPAAARKRLIPTDLRPDGSALSQSIHGWLVQSPSRTMLIDAGVGNEKRRPVQAPFNQLQTDFIEQLAAHGVAPDDVDAVLLTHLHVDHIGWNTRWVDDRWVPTFPNARYVFSVDEYRFYAEPARRSQGSRDAFDDSVEPVVAAGQADMIRADGSQAMDGVVFHATPGHSAHHASIELHCGDDTALFGGDVLHTPVQVYRPEWNSVFCEFADSALASRRWLLNYAASRQATYFSTHFAGSSAGRIETDGTSWAWRYV